MVIHQGSLIDRIDLNIEDTFDNMTKGVEHLKGAEQKADGKFAKKCILILFIAVAITALILAFKYG